jgi:hypothetical protein
MRPYYLVMSAVPVDVAALEGFERCEFPDDLLPLDTLRNLPRKAPDASGMYFLWRGPQLLYIGYSAYLADRMDMHWRAQRQLCRGRRYPFTHYTCLALPLRGLEQLEHRYILAYRPPFNDRIERAGYGRRAEYTSDLSTERHL